MVSPAARRVVSAYFLEVARGNTFFHIFLRRGVAGGDVFFHVFFFLGEFPATIFLIFFLGGLGATFFFRIFLEGAAGVDVFFPVFLGGLPAVPFFPHFSGGSPAAARLFLHFSEVVAGGGVFFSRVFCWGSLGWRAFSF